MVDKKKLGLRRCDREASQPKKRNVSVSSLILKSSKIGEAINWFLIYLISTYIKVALGK